MQGKLTALTLLAGVGLMLWSAEGDAQAPVRVTEQHYRVYRGDGSQATIDELLTAAREATVTFLGETHDDRAAHYLEEQVLRNIYAPGLTLSLEMFESDVQYVVDEYLADQIAEEHLVESGRAWPNYKSDYRPLIEFAKERGMPVIAANAPRRYVNRVTRLGVASLLELGDEAKRSLPPLPYADASPRYAKKFNELMEDHRRSAAQRARDRGDLARAKELERPGNHTKSLAAQSLWDASMAYSIARTLTAQPGARILHVNGSFHSAERMGILEHLERYRPDTSVVVITMLTDDSFPRFDSKDMTGLGDFVVVTDPALTRSYGTESDEDGADRQ